jgi:antitoxin component YwqK of YwqJK toxin-antitoxin module
MKKLLFVSSFALFLISCGADHQEEYYESGSIHIDAEVDAKGVRNGVFKEYYEDGTIKAEGTYKDGKLDGTYKEYYQGGVLSIEAEYKADSIFGIFTSYYSNKNKMKEVVYTPGTQTGKVTEYYENGKVKITGALSDGKQDGTLTSYFESGQVETIDNYKNGVQHGNYETYFQNGQIKLQAEIAEGKTVFYMQYDSTGVLTNEYHEVKVNQSSSTFKVGDVMHFEVNVTGDKGPNAYFRLLLANDNLSPVLNEQTQNFQLFKIGTVQKFSYIYSYEDKQNHKVLSTGPVPASKVIEKSDEGGKFSVDITAQSKGSYVLLGVVNVISAVDAGGVERLSKTYPFMIKFEVR